ncbi:hypothetical protein DLM77_21160 [Leptospira yasudae]|uniref:Hint domain-containing protein n=1 Tax=Leptospira yasudae TaxID=2202201 RepID=A0ABX9LXZ1_9LEPT|nr:hypothetical protein DLM77_21160 [Leptospira yasudae]
MTGAESPLSGKHFEPSRLTPNTIYYFNKLLFPKPALKITHRPDNLLTGEREVDGGWGGGVNVAVKGSESLSGYMFNGGLSFQPGSGVGINLNVSFPGSSGMPPGTFLGVNYEAGSGNYTASGGFNIYGDAGFSISAGKDGYASFGLNYNKDGKGWLNNLSGVGLTMGSDGVFTLSHQFKGSDTLSIGYNTNTHGFSPIGVNGNFINDLNLSLIQEHAAKGNADAIKKLADYYGNVLVERGVISAEKMGELMTKSGGHEELISLYDSNKQTAFANGDNSPEAIKWKSDTTQAVEQLRSEGLNITMGGQSQSGGFFNDLFTSFQNSMGNATNGNGGFDTNGAFSINTCFTAGTLVHTKNGLKKIEELGIGDQVLSWDEESGETSYKTVTELFVHEINHLYDVEVNQREIFHTTWNHPFWVVTERSWVQVKDLKVGDIVQLKDGSSVPITGIRPYSLSMTPVYNLEVEENHTYYVGKDGVLVHNYDPTSMALAKQYARSLSDQKLLDACSSSACKQQVSNEINAGLELGFKGLPLPADASEALRKGYSDGLADRAENQANIITGTGLVGVGLAAWLPQALLPTAISLSDKIPLLGRMLGLSPNASGQVANIEGQLSNIPGRVQSRINLANEGWFHLIERHFSGKTNASQFTVTQAELRTILQSKEIVNTPVTGTLETVLPSGEKGLLYIRQIDMGSIIGKDKFNSFQPTRILTILTDKFGNLVTATPGVIKQ